MSKSLKNYAAAPEALDKYGADAIRQWAAGGGATGSDIPYRVQDVEYGRRFLVKLWNVSGFTGKLLADYQPGKKAHVDMQPLDHWILSKMETTNRKVTDAFDKCQFNLAVEEIRNFTWHVFCDAYVEAVKDRLYRPEIHGEAQKIAAQQTLYEVLFRVLQMLSPVVPHLTDEIYQAMYCDLKGFKSLQQSPWPEANEAAVDEAVEKRGDLIVELIGEVRREKAEKRMPLNTPVKTLTVYAGDQSAAEAINSGESDISGALKVEKLVVLPEAGTGREVIQFSTVHFAAEYGEPIKTPKQ